MTRKRAALFAAAAVLTALCASLLSSPQATAYDTWDDHRYLYGVVGQKYWLDDTAVAHNESAIVNGVANWNASATPVSFSRTYTKSSSRLDFYRVTFNDQYCAYTSLWVNTTRLAEPPNQNWWWAKVNNRPQLKDTDVCGAATHREGIMSHEMGHAMGLAHVNNSGALMYVGISGTSVNNPQADDRNGINHLY